MHWRPIATVPVSCHRADSLVTTVHAVSALRRGLNGGAGTATGSFCSTSAASITLQSNVLQPQPTRRRHRQLCCLGIAAV